MMSFDALSGLIRNRKTNYAYDFSENSLTDETIKEIITNGLWAPTHKLTQPWRFVVLQGEHPKKISEFMASFYRKLYTEDEFSKTQFEATKTYALNATMIGIVFSPKKKAQLPEWEELAAISCAVQNMWLSATALRLGCYWDTSIATITYGNNYIELVENEQFLGVLMIGKLKENLPSTNRKRKPLSKKVTWLK